MVKVPYKMQDVIDTDPNGYDAISLFSGCGGSSIGYRLAGFKMLYANEFIPAAKNCYEANCMPYTKVDGRDIREVQPEEILNIIGKKRGELDLLDGSPPCASFSSGGKVEKSWGQVRKYSDTKQRTDDLFFEFARMIEGIYPKVFVAENVKGLVTGKAKGYFKEIYQSLVDKGYELQAKLLNASQLGVAQARQRVIFVGVRKDLKLSPVFAKPMKGMRVVDVVPWIMDTHDENNPMPVEKECYLLQERSVGKMWHTETLGKANKKTCYNFRKINPVLPCPTICAEQGNGGAALAHPFIKRYLSLGEGKRLQGFPDDFNLNCEADSDKVVFAKNWERLGRSVPPIMMFNIAKTIQYHILEEANGN